MEADKLSLQRELSLPKEEVEFLFILKAPTYYCLSQSSTLRGLGLGISVQTSALSERRHLLSDPVTSLPPERFSAEIILSLEFPGIRWFSVQLSASGGD